MKKQVLLVVGGSDHNPVCKPHGKAPVGPAGLICLLQIWINNECHELEPLAPRHGCSPHLLPLGWAGEPKDKGPLLFPADWQVPMML